MSVPIAPAYPLSREELRRALATGHGRAWIHVERFGAVEVRDEILAAATVSLVCDQQVNGTRGEWLADLCLAAGLAETIVAQPIPAEHADREQRVALLQELARRGIAGAREALYACFGRARWTSDCYASREIIELDGAAGLVFVARAMGDMLVRASDFSVWGYELSVYDEQHGEGAARALLEREAATDASVRLYLEHVRRYEAELEAKRAQQPASAGASRARSDPRVLSGHSRADSRGLALEALARGDANAGLESLRSSAQPEDAKAVLLALESLRDASSERIHSAGSAALELLEECPELPGAAILLEIYAWNPCAHCRGLALEELLRLDACPRWVLDQAAHDGTPWIRELAECSQVFPTPPGDF